MTQEELNNVFELHRKWINNDEGGVRADLSGAKLRWVDLRGADLSGAKLRWVDLRGADLRGANLRCVDLRGANLSEADFRFANLSEANLSEANLSCTDLRWAILSGATLYGANISEADFRFANLRGVDLSVAGLYGATLYGADLRFAKNVPYIPMMIPEGTFVAWKQVKDKIIKLHILDDSKRSRATTEKCRCDKALVVEIQNIDGTPSELKKITNYSYKETTYKVGEIVYADSWDEDRWNECSHGIHFFIDRQSAVDY